MTTQAASTTHIPGAAVRPSAKLLQPRCPSCSTRGTLACVYTAPADYEEPAPRFYRCSGCSARFFRTGLFGRFSDASGAEFDAAFAGRE